VFPVHPRTKKIISQTGLELNSHIHQIEPVGYFEMLALENACDYIVTDSGGVQKEAYFFNKPCITLRDTTEWVELVTHGWNMLVGSDELKIRASLEVMPKYGNATQLYGDGNSADHIASTLLVWKK
jgi:UDP-GlcNAc3NAcA epimerase